MPIRIVGMFGILLIAATASFAADEAEKSGPVFEMRTYVANPGKMADLHKRFRDHTTKLFEKHGMKNVGYWVPVDQPDTLVYIISHPSRDAAKKSWKEFAGDPEWKKAFAASHENGVLVKNVKSVFMTPTDYSPIK